MTLCTFTFLLIFLIGGSLLYNIVLVSAIHHQESAICIHMSLPFRTSLPPPTSSHLSRLSQSTRAPYSKFPLAIYFTYSNEYVSMLLCQLVPLSPSPTASTGLSSISVSPLLLCKRFLSTIFIDSIYMH